WPARTARCPSGRSRSTCGARCSKPGAPRKGATSRRAPRVRGRGCKSERNPGSLRRQVHVADVHSLPPADPEAHRREDDVPGSVVRDADSADEVETSFDAAEALEDRVDVVEVVDQDEGLRRAAPDVESK